ncbi:hypothetical protein [Aquimonas voraii]|uniref:Uncharacterized protein n=1 Tax=Aquimonas voraii TaxID=265719 RepID=A0A1G6TXE7_9GAMM|nr:hypothetical protein [Aquimonas voraii]SDD33729.1 hypothetical protein SAMN04488509_10256 [Aquimonas voraii]
MPQDWLIHPHLQQSALEARARLRQWRSRPGETLFHLLAMLALAMLATFFLGALSTRLSPLVEAWRGHGGSALGLFVLIALAALQRRARRFEAASRAIDWLSALPVGLTLQRRGQRQHLLLGLGLGLLWVLAGSLAALASRVLAPHEALVLATQGMAAVLLAGGLTLALQSRPGRLQGARTTASSAPAEAKPTLGSEARGWAVAPRWLGPWPELGQLQRRSSQRAWRSGRAWVWLLPLGLMVLAGEGARVLAGMLLLVLMLPWLRTALDASARALAEAERLLLATPRSRIEFCRSGWRYPASRALLASVVCALALSLFGAPPLNIALGALALLLLCGLEIALMLHYPRSRARQRGQLMAEVALLLVLAREGLGPAVLLPALGMIGWHAWRARRLA